MKKYQLFLSAVLIIYTAILQCSIPVISDGGDSGSGSEVIALSGKITYENQLPAVGTAVVLRSIDSVPPLTFDVSSFQQISYTDTSGSFALKTNYKGKVLLEAIDSTGLSTAIRFSTDQSGSLPVIKSVLQSTVFLTGSLSAVRDTLCEYEIFIPGLRRFRVCAGEQFSVFIPAGSYKMMIYKKVDGGIPVYVNLEDLRPGETRDLGILMPPLSSDTSTYVTLSGYINPPPIIDDQYLITDGSVETFTNSSGFYSLIVPESTSMRLFFNDVLEDEIPHCFQDKISYAMDIMLDTLFLEHSPLIYYGVVRGNLSPVPSANEATVEIENVIRKRIDNSGRIFLRVPPGDHELKLTKGENILKIHLDSILHGEIRELGTINW
ncbi:MAG TPA: hypothetical protein VHP36_03055 [Chitinispirillaceae bacterium]|nr:hypothetical protein [Chitinispirillaceae bacterium]